MPEGRSKRLIFAAASVSVKECKVPTAMSPQDTGAAGMGKREEFRDEGGHKHVVRTSDSLL